jgi:hypothetical protein
MKFNRALIVGVAFSLFGPSLELCAQGTFPHSLPPPENIVGAGFNLEYGDKCQKAALYTLLAGSALTGILATAEGARGTAAPWIAGTVTLGASVSINLHGLKFSASGGRLLAMPYSPSEWYEQMPDSMGRGKLAKLKFKDYLHGERIHVPGRARNAAP